MKKLNATKVGCQACKSDKGVNRTKNFIFIFGGLMFGLSIYGTIRLINDIMSLF